MTIVNFRIGNLELTADVIVSGAIDEVLLRSDWLRKKMNGFGILPQQKL
jgi:hypothetical protein